MQEELSTMGVGTYIAKKAASEISTQVRPTLTNWYLNKWWPFDAESIVLDFHHTPDIRLNYQYHSYKISIDFQLRNFSYYIIEIISCVCDISVGSFGFMSLKETPLLTLKQGERAGYQIGKSLTPGEIDRAKALFDGSDIKEAVFSFRFAAKTRLGLRYLNPNKHLCLRLFENR
jgi:hypothetical protein